MASSQRDTCFITEITTATYDRFSNICPKFFNRPTQDAKCKDRNPTHSVHIADCVGGSNATKLVWVVTIGKKKSVVLMRPLPLPNVRTAASSRVSLPTIKFGCVRPLEVWPRRISSNTCGLSLQPQPAPWLNSVSLTVDCALIERVIVGLR